jgi:DNA-binding NarL/FixJ family response regulator
LQFTKRDGVLAAQVIRILIADDHEVTRYGIRGMLDRQSDWKVIAEASNGKEAISKAIDTKPDVAILDYAMPLTNGLEATRQIRARVPQTEVLIFTAYEDNDLIERCFRAGARSYLLKSDMQGQLRSAIEFLAMHKPFIGGKVAEILLDCFWGRMHFLALADERPPEREPSVLQLLAEGHTTEQIARRFNMDEKLVKALVNYAHRKRLIVR